MTSISNRDAFSALASTLAIKLFDSWPERIDIGPPSVAASAGALQAFANGTEEMHWRLQQLAIPTIEVLRRSGIIEVENEDLSGKLYGVILSTDAYRALDRSTGALWWKSTLANKLRVAITAELAVELSKSAYTALADAWPEISSSIESLISGAVDS